MMFLKNDENQLVFLDLETTGLSPKRGCGILEICIYSKVGGCFTTLIDPGHPIPARITEINGIDRDMITGAPLFSEIARTVYDQMFGKIIVGHNVQFDLKFLFAEFLAAGIDPQPMSYICTCKTEQHRFGMGGNRLYESLQRRGIDITQEHKAEDDVNMVRELFMIQQKEGVKHTCHIYDMDVYRGFLQNEHDPMFPVKAKQRTTHSLKAFDGWGDRKDEVSIDLFNRLIEEICEDRVFDANEMDRIASIQIDKKVAQNELRKAMLGLIADYYEDGKITWDEFSDLEELATLFGFNTSVHFTLIKEIVPGLKVVCFTNELVVKDVVVDRYETLFPWAVENGYLPSANVTKQTNLLVNCGEKDSRTGKIEKARDYGIAVCHVSDFMSVEMI